MEKVRNWFQERYARHLAERYPEVVRYDEPEEPRSMSACDYTMYKLKKVLSAIEHLNAISESVLDMELYLDDEEVIESHLKAVADRLVAERDALREQYRVLVEVVDCGERDND